MISHSWFDGAVPCGMGTGVKDTPDIKAQARLGTARLVRWTAKALADKGQEMPPCPSRPCALRQYKCKHPVPCDRRSALSVQAQWVAYLYDHLGLWPDERNPPRAIDVKSCEPGPRTLPASRSKRAT